MTTSLIPVIRCEPANHDTAHHRLLARFSAVLLEFLQHRRPHLRDVCTHPTHELVQRWREVSGGWNTSQVKRVSAFTVDLGTVEGSLVLASPVRGRHTVLVRMEHRSVHQLAPRWRCVHLSLLGRWTQPPGVAPNPQSLP